MPVRHGWRAGFVRAGEVKMRRALRGGGLIDSDPGHRPAVHRGIYFIPVMKRLLQSVALHLRASCRSAALATMTAHRRSAQTVVPLRIAACPQAVHRCGHVVVGMPSMSASGQAPSLVGSSLQLRTMLHCFRPTKPADGTPVKVKVDRP